MSRGSYLGGSTVIGPGSRGWFGYKGKRSGKGWKSKPNPKAIAAAIRRHHQQLEIEYYSRLAEVLRNEGFSESEVQRGLSIQKGKELRRRKEPVKQ